MSKKQITIDGVKYDRYDTAEELQAKLDLHESLRHKPTPKVVHGVVERDDGIYDMYTGTVRHAMAYTNEHDATQALIARGRECGVIGNSTGEQLWNRLVVGEKTVIEKLGAFSYDIVPLTPKPVVWVRKEPGMLGYSLCDASGELIEIPGYSTWLHLEPWKSIPGIDVRIWQEPKVEPRHEWVYWTVRSGKGWITETVNSTCSCNYGTIEEHLAGLGLANSNNPNYKWNNMNRATPTFGVRRLTEGEREEHPAWSSFAAFYQGNPLSLCGHHTPEGCIKAVLKKLTPATPAVTLSDLEVVD